ncbi:MAG TPA: ubiquinol-cytochrome C chaperone family protein, partial [Xanthobacteraceae bacterium]|nr:ubiquinol-cytochrome C chaperone family protein [Xanthobacteraceae bacterium]
ALNAIAAAVASRRPRINAGIKRCSPINPARTGTYSHRFNYSVRSRIATRAARPLYNRVSSGGIMFQRLRFQNDPQAQTRSLYGAIVAQARAPAFYGEYGVPDTVEGRFDMVLMHVYLVWRRLSQAGGAARETAQQVFDLFFQDMDESMRELGVGDLSVPRKVRAMGEAFYGRAGVYDTALAKADDVELAAAIQRNVFGDAEGTGDAAARLARYLRAADRLLGVQAAEAITAGEIRFPQPEEIPA